MEQYTGFAEVYDMFMDNVPYDEWADYLHGLLRENGIESGIVAELGCGTGKMTRRLRDRGYDMIGIDISDEMLQIALEKENGTGRENGSGSENGTEKENGSGSENGTEKENGSGSENGSEGQGKGASELKDSDKTPTNEPEILYLCQDMREFELYGSVAAVVSVCDSMNYITDEEELLQVFGLVHNYLDPGGYFIFDMNTEYYYKYVLGEQTICENRDEGSFIWENYFDEETGINEFDMTIFARHESGNGNDDLFRRFTETHYQKAYGLASVRRLLKQAGMKNIRVFAAMTHDAPARGTERVYFLAQK